MAVTRAVAADIAIKALGANTRDGAEIIFATRRPLRAGVVIREGGPTAPGRGAPGSHTDRRGVTTSPARRLLRVGRSGAWLFYDDRAPFQGYEHAGRVALVDSRTGQVRLSREMDWPPLVNGELPSFLADNDAYLDPANRVFYHPYQATTRAITDDPFPDNAPFAELAEAQRAANLLAAEHSCALRFSDSLFDHYFDFGAVRSTRERFGSLLRRLAQLNSGFHSAYYTRADSRIDSYVRRYIDKNDCQDVLLYFAGAGFAGDGSTVSVGFDPHRSKIDHQDVSASQLRELIRSQPDVTFKLVVDAPYSGGMNALADLPNVLIVATPSGAKRGAFAYLPEVEKDGQLVSNTSNGQGLLEFTNRLLMGLDTVMRDPNEVAYAASLQRQGKTKSVLAWFIARALDRASTLDFAANSGVGSEPQTDTSGMVPSAPPQGAPKPVGDFNSAPTADGQAVTASEDSAKAIKLTGGDADGNAITFALATTPAHGALTGTAPNLIYTPNPNYNGVDSFTFTATDGQLSSVPATVALTVLPVNDTPTAKDDIGSVDEDHLLTVVAPAVLANDSDIDGDPLTVTALDGSGSLTHSTSKSASVTVAPDGGYTYDPRGRFESLGVGESGTDSFTYTTSDGHGGSSTATAALSVAGVNDAPVLTGQSSVLGYTESTGPQVVDAALDVADVDSPILAGAKASISGALSPGEDQLTSTFVSGITTAYDAPTGTLTLTGPATRAAFVTALRSIRYANTSRNPNIGGRAVTVSVDDGHDLSNTTSRPLVLTTVNDAPDLVTSVGAAAFTEDGAPVTVDPAITVADVDTAILSAATVQITNNLQPAEDTLTFTPSGGITGSYDAPSGTLSLTGTANPAAYETVLRSVKYADTSQDPSSAIRTIAFEATDTAAATSPGVTRAVGVNPVNDAPTMTAGAALSYTENQAATAMDTTVTLADVDSSSIASATATITGNFVSGEDVLSFANTSSITGSFNATTGTLTLAGADTVANYRAALRDVKYANGSDNPSTANRTVAWSVSDGTDASNAPTSTISVTAVNDAPVVSVTSGAAPWTEAAGPVVVDNGILVADADSLVLSSVTVALSNFDSADVLDATVPVTITKTWNNATKTLTLSGAVSAGTYLTALRTLTFDSPGVNPSSATRTATITASDGSLSSIAATRGIQPGLINDAPTVSLGQTSFNYTENATTALDAGLITADVDNANLTGATVSITGGFVADQDVLAYAATGSIGGAFNSTTGVLTFTGSDTLANYQSILRSVTYNNISDNPDTGDRVFTINVTDGQAASADKTITATVAAVNDAPTLTAGSTLSYTENDAATAASSSVGISDPDNTNIASATVQITGNYASGQDVLSFADTATITSGFDTATGTLTLTGPDTKAAFQSALRAVKYVNTSDDPSTSARTLTFKASDGTAISVPATSTINVTAVNDSPVVTAGAALAYTENDPATVIDSTVTTTDTDDTNLESAAVQITTHFAAGEDVLSATTAGTSITVSFSGDILTLTGTDTKAHYQQVLRTVKYRNTSDNPTANTRTIVWQVNDGSLDGASATSTVAVSAVNDAPTVTAGSTLAVTENDPAAAVDSTVSAGDPDNTNLAGATVAISVNYANGEDVLSFADTATITGTFDPSAGTLTLSGADTVAHYQAALRSVKYVNTSDDPSILDRTVTFAVSDGALSSSAPTSTVTVSAVNDAPTLTAGSALSYTENDAARTVDPTATVVDLDDTNLASATVIITGAYASDQDVLSFTNTATITGSYNVATGTLTLSGSDTVANYQAALRAVNYRNTSDAPSTSPRTVTWKTNDGTTDSNAPTSTVTIAAVDDNPIVTTSGGATNWNGSDVIIDGSIGASDPDSANLTTATVQITGAYASGEDVLAFTATSNITGSFDAVTGKLTLSGNDTIAHYQAALGSVTYSNTASGSPTIATRTITFIVANALTSAGATKTVVFDQAPVLAPNTGTISYSENAPATPIDAAITATDADDANLTAATVQITGGYSSTEDVLSATTAGTSITGSYNPTNGTLALTGADSKAHYQQVVRTVAYRNSSDNPSTTDRMVSFTVNDGLLDSNTVTRTVGVTAVDDAPSVTASGGSTAYTENGAATAVDSALTASDPDGPNVTGATVEILSPSTGDSLSYATTHGIAGSFSSDTLTLSGSATAADYQDALRAVEFSSTNDAPGASRSIRFQITTPVASSTSDKTIAIAVVNDPPVVTTSLPLTATSYTENAAATTIDSGLTVSDPDSANLSGATVEISGNYAGAEDLLARATQFGVTALQSGGKLTLSGSTTVANYQTLLRAATYANSSDNPSTSQRTISFVADDGAAANHASTAATKLLDVLAVDDPPAITASGGTTAYTEQATGATIDNALTLTDPDSNSVTEAKVTVLGPVTGDTLEYTDANGINGSFAAGVLTLSSISKTMAEYQAALRTVKFSSTSDAPGTSRSVRFETTLPTASNQTTKSMAITEINDAPVTTTSASAVDANEQIPTAIDPGLTLADPDGATVNMSGASIQITGNYQSAGGEDVLGFTNQSGITGSFNAVNGKLTLSGTTTRANYETALRSVTFTDTKDAPITSLRTISYQATDAGSNPSNLASNTATRDLNVIPVNDAPTDLNESQTDTGNTRLEVEVTSGSSTNPKLTSATGNLLDNSSDVDDASNVLTVSTSDVSDPPHGTVSVSSDGSYAYIPDAGYTGADSFTYKVQDDEPGTPGKSAASTVTITVSNRVWYTRANAAAGGDGRSETPFNDLAAADSAATSSGDRIYAFRKSGDTGALTDASVDLLATQQLLGSAQDLVVGGNTLYTGASGLRPVLTGTSVALDDGDTVKALSITGPASAPAVVGASGDVSGTLVDLTLTGDAGAIKITGGASGTWDISDVAASKTNIVATTGDAIDIEDAGTVNFTSAGTISTSATNGRGLVLLDTAGQAGALALTGTVDSTTVTSSPSSGVSIGLTTGSLSLDDLNLTTTGTGLSVDDATGITVNNTGDATISSGGVGVDLKTSTLAGSGLSSPPVVALTSVTSTSGAAGINVDDIATGTFSAAGGSLSGASGPEVDLSNGSGNVTYGGTIGDGSNDSVEITNRTGGTVSLSGNINDTADAGGGIDMSGNSGGTYNFTGATKTLNTGATAAVSSTGSAPTINLTGGGLNIDTTSGAGLTATGGGTLNVGTGTNANTIDTTTGTALNVASTNIGATGLTFRSISANGGSNGVVLSSTGPSGGLTVTGNGGSCSAGDTTCSGGRIQSVTGSDGATAGNAIYLSNTRNVSLSNMRLSGGANNGIYGTAVRGLIINKMLSDGNIGTSNSGTFQESVMQLVDLGGTVGITNSDISGGAYHQVAVINTSSTSPNLTIDYSNNTERTMQGSTADVRGNAFTVVASDGTVDATVSNNNFTYWWGTAILVHVTGASASGTATISNNTVSNTSGALAASSGVELAGGNFGFDILNNTVNYSDGTAISIDKQDHSATNMSGTISGNQVGISGVTNSGSAVGTGIFAQHSGPGSTTVAITNNVIRQINGSQAMWMLLGDDTGGSGSGAMNATITGNNIAQEGSAASARTGIVVQAGRVTGDTDIMCADVGGAGALANSITNFNNRIRPNQRFNTTIKMPGYSGAATDDTAVENYLTARNPGTVNVASASGLGGGYLNTSGGAACPQP